MSVHWNLKDVEDYKRTMTKEGRKIEADNYPHGGTLPLEPITRRGEARANLRKNGLKREKGINKARKKLDIRIKDFENTCRKSSTGGREYKKPGSMNPHKH